MKIVTWNCNGAFREKFSYVAELKAEIYVIQECENPSECKHKAYKEWAGNYLWVGSKKHKGIGIFTTRNIDLKKLDWSDKYQDHSVKHFLPCLINNKIQVIGVWTHYNESPTFGYIGQLWKYLQTNMSNLTNPLLIGDFNSNVIWDRWDRWWNHSDVVKSLKLQGIESLYHFFFKEEQGKEKRPTYFMHRNIKKPYHIDYCFASMELTQSLKKVIVPDFDNWKHLSDHVPIVVEFEFE